MTNDQYDQWVKHHAGLFLLHSEDDDKLFVLWRPLLIEFELGDLKMASNRMCADPVEASKFRTNHPALLRQHCFGMRMARDRRIREGMQDRREVACGECHDTGLVIVPNLSCVSQDKWVYPHDEWAVSCSCHKGEAFHTMTRTLHEDKGRQGKPKLKAPIITLQAYEGRVPHWRDLLADRARVRKLEQSVSEEADSIDRRRGPLADLMRRLKERMEKDG